MRKIIGIAGPLGSGKSTIGNHILAFAGGNRSFVLLPFAKQVKEVAYFMGWDGVKDTKGRRLLQLIGTECGRECINQNIWIDFWIKNVLTSRAQLIIVDDLRFLNELNIIKNRGGFVIKIKDRGFYSKHASEQELDDSLFDLLIYNNRTLENLKIILEYNMQLRNYLDG